MPFYRLGLLAGSLLVACGNARQPAEHAPLPVGSSLPPATVSEDSSAVESDEGPALGLYTITNGSERLLGKLQRPMAVTLYASQGVPEVGAASGAVRGMLRAYQRASNGKFVFSVVDPRTEEERLAALGAGVFERPYPDGSNGCFGLAFSYGAERAVIPYVAASDAAHLEFWISEKIRELRARADGIQYRVGVVSDQGELRLDDRNLVPRQSGESPSMLGILAQAFPYYRIEPVDLKDGKAAVDQELEGLIVTQPSQDYVAAELERIDEFLMRGGKSLVVYASAANLKPHDAGLQASLDTHGLEKLLRGYGIELHRDIVFEWDSNLRVNALVQTGTAVMTYPPIVLASAAKGTIDTSFAAFFRMDEVSIPFASSLTLHSGVQPQDVRLFPVAHSTMSSSAISGATVSLRLEQPWKPGTDPQRHILAAVAEGKLKSAFSDVRAGGPSRVLVVASGLFLTNPFAYAGNPAAGASAAGDKALLALGGAYTKHLTSTILSFKNTLDWMTRDEDLIEASARLVPAPAPAPKAP